MLETIKFINKHSDWREILSLPPYCISIKEENGFAILKYSQIDSDFNEQICRECRGLIIDLHNKKVESVALSFYKFFNVQETFADKIYWKTARVQEKIDGSKILVWYNKYDKKWMVSTSGNLDAYKVPVGFTGLTFGKLFDRYFDEQNDPKFSIGEINTKKFLQLLKPQYCYTFELVTPESRVVIPYKKTDLYFIGMRNVDTFEEIDPDAGEAESIKCICKRPKEYPLPNLKSCLTATNHMGYDEEGFVVVDHKWSRVKIKSPAYVAAHYLRNNGVNSQSRILEIIEKNEQSEFLGLFPEYKEYFDDIEIRYNSIRKTLINAIVDITNLNLENKTQKEIAEFINVKYPNIRGFLFTYLKTDLIKMFIDVQWSKLSKDKKMSLIGLKMEEEDE